MGLRSGKVSWQARVDADSSETLLAIAKAEDLSEAALVERGLMLVIEEADRDREILHQRLQARFEAQSKALAGAGAEHDAAEVLEPPPVLDEVPTGDKTFQTRLKAPISERLVAIGGAQDLTESQLVRRGLFLVLEDAANRLPELQKNLQRDHQADIKALKRAAVAVGDPRRRSQSEGANLGAASSTADANDSAAAAASQ